MRTIQMSSYTVGEDCFEAIAHVLAPHHAQSIVLVGGARALAAAAPEIRKALADTSVEILDEIVYGTDSTQSAIDALVRNDAFRAADVAFAIGGGKAIDTVKTAAKELDKTVFSVPTICSNCSSATAIAVVYNDDHSLKGYAYPDAPAHIFINPAIIAEAPAEYFWAGIGDALSKQPEVEYATSRADLTHTDTLGAHTRAHLHRPAHDLWRAGAGGRAGQPLERGRPTDRAGYRGEHRIRIQPHQPAGFLLQLVARARVLQRDVRRAARGAHAPARRGREFWRARAVRLHGQHPPS